jgi:hypothetical protein
MKTLKVILAARASKKIGKGVVVSLERTDM